MLSTAFPPGSPRWIDLGTPDLKATVDFYTQLFGWTAQQLGPEAGDYGFFHLDGRMAAAYGPLGEGASSAWTVYFGTADADATAKAVEQGGGSVRLGPLDVMEEGRMAQFTDPTGAEFAIWQPRNTQGLEVVNQAGSLGWVELHTSDAAAARAFYSSVFDWNASDMPMGAFTYTVLSTGGEDESFGGLMPTMPEGPQQSHWLPYFEVADCDATVVKAQELGGTVLHGPDTLADVGRMALLSDRHGAKFSVITSVAPS
ncbi:VOC family protein [Streptacidiphilus monticola]|uniref:VOC family protein n=1 Tax=Streptacidiphilus monticola TaxID=2161674 RepID=A0ABW1G5G1_9ACTN